MHINDNLPPDRKLGLIERLVQGMIAVIQAVRTPLRLFALLVYGLLVTLWLLVLQRPVSQSSEAMGVVLKVLLAVVIMHSITTIVPKAGRGHQAPSSATGERELAEALAQILETLLQKPGLQNRDGVEAVLARFARLVDGRSKATRKVLRKLLDAWRQRSQLHGDNPRPRPRHRPRKK